MCQSLYQVTAPQTCWENIGKWHIYERGEAGKVWWGLCIRIATSNDYFFPLLADLKQLNFALSTEQLLVNAQTNQPMVQFMKDGPQ